MKSILYIAVYFILLFFSWSCHNEPTIIDGYQDKISYYPNDTIQVFLHADKQGEKKVKLYNINGEVVDEILTNLMPQNINDTAYLWKKGFNYNQTFQYNPKNLKSGVYFFENSSPFIVKNPAQKNEVLIVYPSNTVNAYNKRGGRSAYTNPIGAILSFKRPAEIQSYTKPFLEWLPSQNIKADYVCDADLEEYNTIKNYKKIVIIGHSEYWTIKARKNFDRFVNEGRNALILSGNTMWWQVRYVQNKQVCYKSAINDSLVADSLKTITWDDTLLNYPIKNSLGVDFTHGGFALKQDSGWDGFLITKNRSFFKKAGIKVGDTLYCPSTEFDGAELVVKNGMPSLTDTTFYRYELLGYDIGVNGYGDKAYATFVLMQRTEKSGVIIIIPSTDWCSKGFTGKDSDKIKKLTLELLTSFE